MSLKICNKDISWSSYIQISELIIRAAESTGPGGCLLTHNRSTVFSVKMLPVATTLQVY